MANTSSKMITGSEMPAAQPVYILRGHSSAIHALLFSNSNLQLLSGDADGWVVIWLVTTKRSLAVWRAHNGAILGAQFWGDGRLITHGRDGRLLVWDMSDVHSGEYSTELPVEESPNHKKLPWIFHSLEVSALTFCSFATCLQAPKDGATVTALVASTGTKETDKSLGNVENKNILMAVPGTKDSSIEVFQLPSEKQVAMIPAPDETNGKTGMVMALKILHQDQGSLQIIAGYESGRTYVFQQVIDAGQWETIYTSRPHSQPILSLDSIPGVDVFITSGADAIVAKHSFSLPEADSKSLKEVQTRHAGQQGLEVRSDGKVFATAGWDGRGRVYSAKTMKELAVLKWHKEGCYALGFGTIGSIVADSDSATEKNTKTQLTTAGPNFRTTDENRTRKAQLTHWLALGSKDGKISLWDIY